MTLATSHISYSKGLSIVQRSDLTTLEILAVDFWCICNLSHFHRMKNLCWVHKQDKFCSKDLKEIRGDELNKNDKSFDVLSLLLGLLTSFGTLRWRRFGYVVQ